MELFQAYVAVQGGEQREEHKEGEGMALCSSGCGCVRGEGVDAAAPPCVCSLGGDKHLRPHWNPGTRTPSIFLSRDLLWKLWAEGSGRRKERTLIALCLVFS